MRPGTGDAKAADERLVPGGVEAVLDDPPRSPSGGDRNRFRWWLNRRVRWSASAGPERQLVLRIGLGALLLAAVAGLSAWPMVESHTAGTLAEMLGAEVSLGAARPSLAGVTLQDLQIATADGGFRLRAESLSGAVNPLDVPVAGPAALDGLDAHGVNIYIDLAAADTRQMLRRLEQRLEAAGSGGDAAAGELETGEPRTYPTLAVADMEIEIHDGPRSVVLRDATARSSPDGRGTLSIGSLIYGSAGGGGVFGNVMAETDDWRRLLDSAAALRAESTHPDEAAALPRAVLRMTATVGDHGRLTAALALDEAGFDLELETSRFPLATLPIPARLTEVAAPVTGADGDFRLAVQGAVAGPYELEARGTVRGLRAVSERLAEQPFDLPESSFEIAGRLAREEEGERLHLTRGRVESEGIEMLLAGSLLLAEEPAVELRAQLTPTACDRLLAAIPAPLLGAAADFRLQGSIAADFAFAYDPRQRRTVDLDADFDDRCEILDTPVEARAERFRQPFVNPAPRADFGVLDSPLAQQTGPGTVAWTPFEYVSSYLIGAILLHEDPAFFKHPGFAIWAIRDSVADNLAAGAMVRGASTISMQLAKNLFLDRDKTIARKLQEAIYTWWLERSFDKIEILELYLNVIEFGPNVYGVRQASWHYFGREPWELDPTQASYLAVVLPDPKSYHRDHAAGAPNRSVRREMTALLERMAERGWMVEDHLDFSLAEAQRLRFAAPGTRASRGDPRLLDADVGSTSCSPAHGSR